MNLGTCYSMGKGVKKSDAEAVKWYQKAAEQGDPRAHFNLGVCYVKGLGVRQSYTNAKEHFGIACDKGLDKGCELYARLNTSGG